MSFTIPQVLAWQTGSLSYNGSRLVQMADQLRGAFPSGNFDVASSWQSPAAHGFSSATATLTLGANQLAQRLRSGGGICSAAASRLTEIQQDIKAAQAKAAHAATGVFAGVGFGIGPSGDAVIPMLNSAWIPASPDPSVQEYHVLVLQQKYNDVVSTVQSASAAVKRALQDAQVFDQELASGLANMVSANFDADVSVNRRLEVLAPQHVSGFVKALDVGLHVAPFFGQELAAYEAITGHDGLTGDKASKALGVVGVLPFGVIGKGFVKAAGFGKAAKTVVEGEEVASTGNILDGFHMYTDTPASELLFLKKMGMSDAQLKEVLPGVGKSMLGAGAKKPIAEINKIVAKYGGDPKDWAKMKTSNANLKKMGLAEDDSYSLTNQFEIHYLENVKTGQIEEVKSKLGMMESYSSKLTAKAKELGLDGPAHQRATQHAIANGLDIPPKFYLSHLTKPEFMDLVHKFEYEKP